MASVQIPTEVVIDTNEDLPNGSYVMGGPSGPAITKMTVHIPEYTSSKQFHDILLDHFIEKAKDSFFIKKTGAGTMSTNKQEAERIGPNTVEAIIPAGPRKVKMSLNIFIGTIRFRGGDIEVNDSYIMVAGDGYEITVNQSMNSKAQGCTIC